MRQTETTQGSSSRAQDSSTQQGTSAPLPDSVDVGAQRAALMQRAPGYGNAPTPSPAPGPNVGGLNSFNIIGPGNSSWHIFNGGFGVPHAPRWNSERFTAMLRELDRLLPGGGIGQFVVPDSTTRYTSAHERTEESARDAMRDWRLRIPRIMTENASQPSYRWEPTPDAGREAKPSEARAPLLGEAKAERPSEGTKRATEKDKTDAPKEAKPAEPEKPEKEARQRIVEKSEEKAPERTVREPAERTVRESAERTSAKGESPQAEAKPAGDAKPESNPKTPEPTISRDAQLRGETPRTPELSPIKEPATIVTPNVQAILNDSRNDIARLIAQVIAPDLHARPQPTSTPYPNVELNQYTSANLGSYQASINDKLSQIRDSLQSALQQSSPRQAPDSPPAPSVASRAAGDYSIVEPPRRGATAPHDIQRGDRAVGNHGALAPDHMNKNEVPTKGAPGIIASVVIPPPEGALVRGIRPAGAPDREIPRHTIERAASLTDAISKVIAKVVSVQTLQRLDRALETSVIAIAAAMALGVIGGRMALKELSGVARSLQRDLRHRSLKEDNGTVERSTSDLLNDLEVALTQHGMNTHEGATSQLVADITGRVVTNDHIPVESVIIHGGSLGMTTTDSSGIFRFSNIPLGIAYALTLSDQRYTFSPHHIEGTVSGRDHINVVATQLS